MISSQALLLQVVLLVSPLERFKESKWKAEPYRLALGLAAILQTNFTHIKEKAKEVSPMYFVMENATLLSLQATCHIWDVTSNSNTQSDLFQKTELVNISKYNTGFWPLMAVFDNLIQDIN